MVYRGRGLTAVLAVLVATSCTSGGSSPPPNPGPPEQLNNTPPRVTAERLVEDFAAVGIGTYDPDSTEPLKPVTGDTAYRIPAQAVEALAGGIAFRTGISQSDLDRLTSIPPLPLRGATKPVPTSAFVRAWLVGARTPRARLARSYVRGVDLRSKAPIVLPSAVLALFTVDLLPPTARRPDAASASPAALAAPGGLCTTFQSFIDNAIRSVFEAIGKIPKFVPKSGFERWLLLVPNFVIDVANTGLAALERLASEGVRHLLAPLANAIAAVASVVAVVSEALTHLQPWAAAIGAEPRFPVLGTLSQPGRFTLDVTGLTGIEEWPQHIKDCAQWSKVTLPSLRPRNANVTWRVAYQHPQQLLDIDLAGRHGLSEQGTDELRWMTVVEPPDVANGHAESNGSVMVTATITRRDIDELNKRLVNLLVAQIPRVLQDVFGDVLRAQITPVVTRLTSGLAALRTTSAQGWAYPIYHTPEETPPPKPTPKPPPKPAPRATFCGQFASMIAWRVDHSVTLRGNPYGGKNVIREQIRRLHRMRPLGDAQQESDTDVLIAIWSIWLRVTGFGDPDFAVLGNKTVELGYPAVAQRLANRCHVPLADIGAG